MSFWDYFWTIVPPLVLLAGIIVFYIKKKGDE